MSLNIIILAAGQGKRMHSALPKVLHTVGGKSLLQHVVDAAEQLHPQKIYVVYGHEGEQLKTKSNHLPVQWVEQTQQLGTGHAVQQVLPLLKDEDRVLILVGDTPLINPQTLQQLLKQTPAQGVGIVTAFMPDPTGLGRIIRDPQGKVKSIVEERDTSEEQRKIKEINTGIIVAPVKQLRLWLGQIKNHNSQGEYYLPDIIPLAIRDGAEIVTYAAPSIYEVQGINDRAQLALLERYYQRKMAEQMMRKGVTLLDPERFDLRGELEVGKDVTIDINVIIEGKVSIGANSYIGPYTILRDAIIGENATIKAYSIIEETKLGADCIIGPYARIRPGTELADKVHIGNFVEVKKSKVGTESKINHLSYIGDTVVGSQTNIGAGTITCNYDGVNKNPTTIGDRVMIGSGTQLVAPVTVGSGATLAAGSTVIQDVEAEALTVTHRLDQRTVAGWKKPKKKEKV